MLSGYPDCGATMGAVSGRYRAPVSYPDTLWVRAQVSALRDDRFIVEYAAFGRSQENLVADADGLAVLYDHVAGCRPLLRRDYRATIIVLEGREPPSLPPGSKRARIAE